MTFSRFVVRNSFRNKRRTALTVLSIGFSIFLLIMLKTVIYTLLNPQQSDSSILRIAVRRSTSLTFQMPLAYGGRLEKIPHVKLVMPMQWFGGLYKDEAKDFFPNFALDATKMFDMFPEIKIAPEARKAFETERMGAVAGKLLAEKFGWKVGDRVTLKGAIFPVNLEFKLVGLYDSDTTSQKRNFYFHHEYMDESLGKPGTVGTFWLMADSEAAVPGIVETVDETFKNSPYETKTETEKAFQLGFVSMLGNVQMLIASFALVVVFTMLLVSASTMAMTIRERMREVGILKAIGYPRLAVLGLILGEAVFIALLGGVVGSIVAFSFRWVDLYSVTRGFLQELNVPVSTYLMGMGAGVVIGLASGFLPALQASGMTITQAIRRLN